MSDPKPPPQPFPRNRDWWLLAAFLVLLLLCGLGSRGLNEPDEGRYANMSMAMAQPGGDWWEPRESGYGHYDKPPFIYWAVAGSFRAFGLSDWAARLPAFGGAVCSLVGLGWAAWRLRGPCVAWWALLICGTSLQFWIMARVVSPDILLTGWCALAIGAWAEGRHRGGPWGPWLLSLLFWTLAWWTKATPALIPLAGLAAGVWLTDDRAGKRALRLAILLPAIIVLGSPWYLSMLHRYPELKTFFFKRELAGRIAKRVDNRHGSILYYLPVCLGAWLPWWPCGAWALWRERIVWFTGPWREQWQAWRQRLGVEGWIVVIGLLIFSLASSKLPSYTIILAPWAALGLARLLMRPASVSPKPLLALAAVVAVTLSIGAVVLPARYDSRLGANSSVRDVCRYLRAHGAQRVDVDRYFPGMEYYLGVDTAHYVVRVIDPALSVLTDAQKAGRLKKSVRRERESDPGVLPNRFIEPEAWPALPPDASTRPVPPGGWWLVHYRKRSGSPFGEAIKPGVEVPTARIGDFVLYQMPAARP